MDSLKVGVYRHFKGHYYLVLGVARHSETEERLVVYVPLGIRKGPRITVRPYDNFFQTVEQDGTTVPRFAYVGDEMSEDTLNG